MFFLPYSCLLWFVFRFLATYRLRGRWCLGYLHPDLRHLPATLIDQPNFKVLLFCQAAWKTLNIYVCKVFLGFKWHRRNFSRCSAPRFTGRLERREVPPSIRCLTAEPTASTRWLWMMCGCIEDASNKNKDAHKKIMTYKWLLFEYQLDQLDLIQCSSIFCQTQRYISVQGGTQPSQPSWLGPQVGAGARTSVFAAEMRCTPRTLVAAPYKISGSPWSIAIAWPETADNCGRAVSGRPGTMDEWMSWRGF